MRPAIALFALMTFACLAAPERSLRIAVRDADGDGRVSKDEFRAGSQGEPATLDRVFAQLDANGDGFLSLEELPQRRGRETPVTPHGPDDEAGPADTGGCRIIRQAPRSALPAYAVVQSSTDASNIAWRAVADALVKKHGASLVHYDGSVTNSLSALRELRPRCTAFVARPEILGRIYVARVHRMTRQFDVDPFGDTQWGIVSAASPAGALRVALATEPRTVRRAIGLTGLDTKIYDELLVIGDGKPGEVLWTKADGPAERRSEGEADRTRLFVDAFAAMKPQLLVGSGHATERNLEMPFSKGNTECRQGRWVGMADWKNELPIATDATPRVFLGAGNCLIGNFQRRPTSMAPTLMEAYGFNQFVGYTVPTWYGKGGWGTLGLWQGQAGRLSLADAWFFNNQLIVDELLQKFPGVATNELAVSEAGEGMPEASALRFGKDASGMLWDRDVVAFYGDPALEVRAGSSSPLETAVSAADPHRLTVRDPQSGSTDPICLWRPATLKGTRILSGAATNSVVTDTFLILRTPAWKSGRVDVRLGD